MSLIPSSKIVNVHGISPGQKQSISIFMQGAVYSWCKNRPEEWFDLMGGENFDWTGTPLKVLFDKYKNRGKSDKHAIAEAGKDAGQITKEVLHDDPRQFETKVRYVRLYKWKK